ncbi:hypothetical protein [Actinophytocola sp.]|uniref:hypothetical protein n=1 Tax=Actinophytocola sp. TaxID=1872138 RepID=UPI003899A950
MVLLGRLKPGTALESRRVVHVFPLLPDAQALAVLTPLCGERLPVEDMQWLPGMTGMPCEPCLMRNGRAATQAPPCGFGTPPPPRRDPTVSAYQRRLLGGTAPSAGPDLTW